MIALMTMWQALSPDPIRDDELHGYVRQFFDGTLEENDLELKLRGFGRQFETNPYTLTPLRIPATSMPEGRLRQYFDIVLKIVRPTLAAFSRDELTVTETAVKVAPFFLVLGGWFANAPTDVKRSRELVEKIREFRAP
jgi:hypothetical protein